MNTWLDYIFYRTVQLFYKRGGRRGLPGVMVISLSQSFLIMAVAVLLENQFIEKTARDLYKELIEFVLIIPILLVYYFNYRKYYGKYNKLRFEMKNEDPNRRFLKGILVLVSLIIPPIIFTIVSKYTH
ncbi:hypothetical protein [Mucilaginibacter celer]|uniref:Uncharacterized protein n=1 Tax=Mucilaginibacter celer TaxID=2305508 RepID=A0A494VRF7_9SPHI|nr:hypothetical protein [Mucilaginibacter celer]AYL98196.1 hypothetical protein HYN43_024215 [Mucilaginibacter celer]